MSRFFENIKLAFRGIFTHKMRSFLTMLGIIIGIASIIAIVSTIKGTNEQIKNNLVGSGTNTVTVSIYQGGYEYEMQYSGIPDGFRPVSDSAMEQIRALDEVESASKLLKRNYADGIYSGSVNLNGGSVYGIDQNYFGTAGLTVVSGRPFSEHDYASFTKVVILDKTAADTLFSNEVPLGKTIEISGAPFTVVGIVETSSRFEPVINDINDWYTYHGSSSGTVYLPSACWPLLYQFDEPESVIVRAKNTDSMTSAGQKTADILNSELGLTEENSCIYKANDLLEQAKQLQELSSSTNSMLIWIAGISLIVGGIGVMNIMLVSVTERTREIGLKKALGAKRKLILGQFLTEAAVLTGIGGIVGVLVGIGLAYIIQFVAAVPVAISAPAILVSVIFSTVVGVVFGLLPSIKAAKLDPIEALRYE